MKFLNLLASLFLLPGTLVLGMLNLNIENDGGIFRSLINMIFWGIVGAVVTVKILI